MANRPDDFDFETPQLGEALRGLYRRPVDVPGQVDQAILHQARGRLRHQRQLRAFRRWGTGLAAAAAVVLVALIPLTSVKMQRQAASPAAVLAQDVDGDGRVDIRDAYLLARQVELDQQLRKEWDFDGDGVVGRADADWIAQAAVRIEREDVR